MLEVRSLSVSYGSVRALRGLSLEVAEGEIVALLGANGAGKSTTLRAIAGVVSPDAGDIRFEGRSLVGMPPEQIVRRGICLAPEGRRIFATLTVEENVRLGAAGRTDRARVAEEAEALLGRFPILGLRRSAPGGTLSGGEQQQLALARLLMARPRLLLLDEPTLGLAPRLVEQVLELVAGLRAEGHTVLMVEQNVAHALDVADRAYVLSSGELVLQGPARELREGDLVKEAYLGRGAAS